MSSTSTSTTTSGGAAGAPPEPVKIMNFQRMGQLAKTWATGVDHVKDGNEYKEPKDLPDFKKQLETAGVGATIPANYLTLTVVQGTDTNLVILLPSAALVIAAEEELKKPGSTDYQLPPFYAEFAFEKHKHKIKNKIHFHDMRIGDYTISNCR